MSAKILDGKKLASLSEEEIKAEVSELISKGINPTLATILVGNDPASETCLLYTSPSPRDYAASRMPSSA